MASCINQAITYLWKQRCIGERHIPEMYLIRFVLRHRTRDEIKEFQKDFRAAVNEGLIIRLKKRTGKGSGYHISLNPSRIPMIHELYGVLK
jgi:hypothetical protein